MRKLSALSLLVFLSLFSMAGATVDYIGKPDTLSAANAKTTLSGDGYGTVGFQITGTWSGTVTFEGTVNGSTWVSINAYNRATGTGATTTTANGVYVLSSGGIRYVRARVSSYSSGSLYVQGLASIEQSVVDGGASSSGGGGGDASAANQTSGNQLTQIVDSSGSKIGSTNHSLNVAFGTGTSHIGSVKVDTVPADPFGANADAASATGSISGKLRFIASTGIPITGTVTVGTHAVTQSGTWTVQPGNTANTTAWLVTGTGGTFPVTFSTTGSGTATGALRVELPTNGTGVLASIGSITSALPAGTNIIGALVANQTVDVNKIAGTATSVNSGNKDNGTQRFVFATDQPTNTNPFTVQGGAAHGASSAGNPFGQGVEARTSDPTLTTNGQATKAIGTPDGKQVMMPYAIRPSKWFYAPPAAGLTGTTAVKVKAGSSGLRQCITSIQAINEHQTIGSEFVIYANPGAGASTDTLWRGWAQFTGGGASVPMPVDICTPNTGDSLKIAEKTATGTNGILINLQGYTTAE